MEAIELTNLFAEYKNDPNLTNEQKTTRLDIINSEIARLNRNKTYSIYVEKYKNIGLKLEELSKGKFTLNSHIEESAYELEDFVLSLDVVKYLQQNDMCIFQYEDLIEISKKMGLDYNIISVAYELYKVIEKIKRIEENKVTVMEMSLVDFMGLNIASRYNYICKVTETEGHMEKTLKTNNELELDYKAALLIVEKNKEFLGYQVTQIAIGIVDELFSYYKNGYKEIDLNQGKQIRA